MTTMTRDSLTRPPAGPAPANDHLNDGAPRPFAPEQVRAALRPLVQLLARQAAREWLSQIANDNTPHRSRSSGCALPDAKPCHGDKK